MPRPVFGQADWFTFNELDDDVRFRRRDRTDCFTTDVACAGDELARSLCRDEDEEVEASGAEESGYPTWPGFEFCVSRGNKVVLMVRRPEK